MKIAYIAGPYRTKNWFKRILYIYRARKVALKYWKLGYAVICPHSNSGFFDGKADEATVFLRGYLKLVTISQVLVMLPDWKKSKGSVDEHWLGQASGKKIIYE